MVVWTSLLDIWVYPFPFEELAENASALAAAVHGGRRRHCVHGLGGTTTIGHYQDHLADVAVIEDVLNVK